MKRISSLAFLLALTLLLTGCQSIVGGKILEMFGVEFTSQIEWLEKCLSVDLEDLTDKQIKTLCSQTDPSGNALTIQYIDLEGSGDEFSQKLQESKNWLELPCSETIYELLTRSGAYEVYDFSSISYGYYTISGLCENISELDFDMNNFDLWYGYQIGIYDANDECLYYISIIIQDP